MLDCLKRQTHKNFELVYVDALKRSRPKGFIDLMEEYRQYFPITHIVDKPREPSKFPGISNARNSGIIYASGETVLMCGDHTYLQEFWVERHVAAYSMGFNSTSPLYIIKNVQEDLAKYPRGRILKHPMHPLCIFVQFGPFTYEAPMDIRCPDIPEEAIFSDQAWVPCPAGWYHTVSAQASLDRLLNVNGFNESYDRNGYGFEDNDAGLRMFIMGFPPMFDPGNWIVEIDEATNPKLIADPKMGEANKKLYDELSERHFPIWANPQFNLRKMREKLEKT
jgi:glycosyltransferase involved in cell wall biosynthesis